LSYRHGDIRIGFPIVDVHTKEIAKVLYGFTVVAAKPLEPIKLNHATVLI
jgi:hypothetical protein